MKWLCDRLDKYVETAEEMKPGSKGRRDWLLKADKVRDELRILDH